jgi:Kef-type K+ transport system membrane component KefB
MKTNRTVLSKGLKLLALTVVLMFVGPFLMYVAFSNQEKPLYIPILIASFLICGAAVFFGFKGIHTIIDSVFKKANSD